MKKILLFAGAVVGLFAVNGYARGVTSNASVSESINVGTIPQDKAVRIGYQCPEGCHLVGSSDVNNGTGVGSTSFGCQDDQGNRCADPKVVVNGTVVSSIRAGQLTEEPVEVLLNTDTAENTQKKSNVNSARVAKTNSVSKTLNTTRPSDTEPVVQDKVASGDIHVEYVCPSGCTLSFAAISLGSATGTSAQCVTSTGHLCADPTVVITDDNGNVLNSAGGQGVANISSKTNASSQKKTNTVSARASKVGTQVKKTDNITPVAPQVQEKVGSGLVKITCPAGCTPDCAIVSNIVLCECQDENGNACPETVLQTNKKDLINIR